jgi:hypothetical protein
MELHDQGPLTRAGWYAEAWRRLAALLRSRACDGAEEAVHELRHRLQTGAEIFDGPDVSYDPAASRRRS